MMNKKSSNRSSDLLKNVLLPIKKENESSQKEKWEPEVIIKTYAVQLTHKARKKLATPSQL